MCSLREQKICGSLYKLQTTYNVSHAAMRDAAAAAESAFDHYEASKQKCKELTVGRGVAWGEGGRLKHSHSLANQ